jgi:hypothetical protein
MKKILNRIAFNIGYAYGYVKTRCKLIGANDAKNKSRT